MRFSLRVRPLGFFSSHFDAVGTNAITSSAEFIEFKLHEEDGGIAYLMC